MASGKSAHDVSLVHHRTENNEYVRRLYSRESMAIEQMN